MKRREEPQNNALELTSAPGARSARARSSTHCQAAKGKFISNLKFEENGGNCEPLSDRRASGRPDSVIRFGAGCASGRRQELIKAERDLADAFMKRDLAALERILADEFIDSNPDRTPKTKPRRWLRPSRAPSCR